MIEIGACKVKGKLSSMPSNDYNVTSVLMRDTSAQMGILELQGWTDGMDPDSDWVMSALLVSCPQPRLRYVWPDFSWDICFRMFL